MDELLQIISSLLQAFEAQDIRYMIGGSFASSLWGQPRQTNDLDLAILLDPTQVDALVASMIDEFVIDRATIDECLDSTDEFRSFQMIHKEHVFKMDVFVLRGSEFDLMSMRRARLVELESGRHVFVASPEDMILTKLRWFELGNRVSDRQWRDILEMWRIQGQSLDKDYIEHWAKKFALTELYSLLPA